MTHTISADDAGNRIRDLVERAVSNDERFLIDRDGEPAVIMMSVADFVKTIAPTPEWLKKIQDEARARGTDKLTPSEIDAARLEARFRQS